MKYREGQLWKLRNDGYAYVRHVNHSGAHAAILEYYQPSPWERFIFAVYYDGTAFLGYDQKKDTARQYDLMQLVKEAQDDSF